LFFGVIKLKFLLLPLLQILYFGRKQKGNDSIAGVIAQALANTALIRRKMILIRSLLE
jgi:hypothetical protein